MPTTPSQSSPRPGHKGYRLLNNHHDSMRERLNFRELEFFVSICEAGSISAASRRAGISQSAATQLLQRLEQRMKVTLFDRSKRPLRLTRDGNDVLNLARPLLIDAQRFAAHFEGPASERQFDLRLGVVESLSLPFIPHLVAALDRRLGQLSVMVGSTNQQRAAFLDRRLDVMIMSDPHDDLAEVESHLVAEEPFVLLVPKGRQVLDTAGLRELAGDLPLIRFGYRSTARSKVDAQLKRMRVNVRRSHEMDTPDLVIGMVAAGLGWTLTTPLSLHGARQNMQDLDVVRFPGPQFVRRIYLASRVHELGHLSNTLATISRGIMREFYIPKIFAREPWLKESLIVPD